MCSLCCASQISIPILILYWNISTARMELHSINENNFEMKAPTMSLFDYRQFFAGLLPNIDLSLDSR